jgi:predicted Zn finger-like uncharacterized protein
MIIVCPQCQSRYRINPPAGSKPQARVKCPNCQNTFDITLAVAPVAVEASAVTPASPEGDVAKPLVLVVDDARFFREMIRDLLADLPIRVETAGDGHEALQMINKLHPALLLLDLNIPGVSGQDIIAAVRRDAACNTVRILAMSGVQRGEEAAHDVRRLGADDFINKSFRPRDLQNRVRQILGL